MKIHTLFITLALKKNMFNFLCRFYNLSTWFFVIFNNNILFPHTSTVHVCKSNDFMIIQLTNAFVLNSVVPINYSVR